MVCVHHKQRTVKHNVHKRTDGEMSMYGIYTKTLVNRVDTTWATWMYNIELCNGAEVVR